MWDREIYIWLHLRSPRKCGDACSAVTAMTADSMHISKAWLFLPVVYKVSRHFHELALLMSFGPNKVSFSSFAPEMSKDITRLSELQSETW
jgi:hypothetical protein